MAWHIYLVPVLGTGASDDERVPKYVDALSGIEWAALDYGFDAVMLVAANVSDAQDTQAAAQSDVTKIPDNLDGQIGAGALTAVQNALENRNLPAGWITQSLTYRQVLRTLGGFFAFKQRYAAISGNATFGGAVTLDTQFNQLSQTVRNNLQATATDLGLSADGLQGTSTIRAILKNIADQWGQRPIKLGGITI